MPDAHGTESPFDKLARDGLQHDCELSVTSVAAIVIVDCPP